MFPLPTVNGCMQWLSVFGLASVGLLAHAADPDGPASKSPPVHASEFGADTPSPGSDSVRAGDAAKLREAPQARWSADAEALPGGYRWSLSRGVVDMGLRFESASPWLRPHEARTESAGPLMGGLPAVSFGLRQAIAERPAGSLLSRASGATSSFVSKVGIEWKPAESRVNFLREGLGIRLDGNDRMTVRLRKGVIGVYMHRKF